MRYCLIKCFVWMAIVGSSVVAFAVAVTISEPGAGPPLMDFSETESIVSYGTVEVDSGTVWVRIRKTGQTTFYEVDIDDDPTDGHNNWGNNYVPDGGTWSVLGEHIIMVFSDPGSATRNFNVVEDIPP